jgi:hypothetical protein
MSDFTPIASETIPNDPTLVDRIMASERRSWAVVSNRANPFGPLPPITEPLTKKLILCEPMTAQTTPSHSDRQKSYWSKMTPAERSAEIARRCMVTKAKRAAASSQPHTETPAPIALPLPRERAWVRGKDPSKKPSADIQVSRLSLHSLAMEYERRLAILEEVREWIGEVTEA